MEEYNLVILGGGSAAFAAAIKASEIDAKFVIIESGTLGGTCVNVGCVPSKHLLSVGDAYYYSKNHGFRGIKTGETSVDFSEVIQQKDGIVQSLRKRKYIDVLENLPGATFIKGKGVFTSQNKVAVDGKVLRADKFIIATGSSPNIIKLKGIDKVDHLTNVEALSLKELPKSMIIIGGRAVALEFAQMYAHFGTKVTVLQRSPRILPKDEPEISEELARCLRDEDIEIYTGVQTEEVDERNGMKIVKCRVKGEERKFEAEQILMATGRKPNTEDIGL
ncbi:MAG: FAD-dependent oxidoreductase, partial [Candidatus Bathyarchaeia archaeon]